MSASASAPVPSTANSTPTIDMARANFASALKRLHIMVPAVDCRVPSGPLSDDDFLRLARSITVGHPVMLHRQLDDKMTPKSDPMEGLPPDEMSAHLSKIITAIESTHKAEMAYLHSLKSHPYLIAGSKK